MAKKPEKPEKLEKPEKTETPERPEKPEAADLLALMAALHRQHSRLRWTVVGLTLFTLAALAGASAALLAPYNAELGLYLRRWLGRPETIAVEKTILEAEKFALRTPDGKARAGLELGADGHANLWFAGQDGQVTVSLNPRSLRLTDAEGGVFVTRTALVLADRKQRNRVTLGVLPNNASGLSLFDKGGSHRAALSVVPDGSPRLELFDAGGGRRANLALSGEGLPALQLEEKGQPRAVLGAGSEGKRKASTPSSLLLFDKDGSVIFQAPIY